MESIDRPVFVPIILGTARQGRLSEPAARFVFEEVSRRPDVKTEWIDIRNLRLSIDDAGEAIKDAKFSATVASADGLILVVPEYNHSFSRAPEARARHQSKGICSQSRWRVRCLCRALRWRPHDSESPAGFARTWTRRDL